MLTMVEGVEGVEGIGFVSFNITDRKMGLQRVLKSRYRPTLRRTKRCWVDVASF